jgi:ribosomal protein L32
LQCGFSIFPLAPGDKFPHARLLPTSYDTEKGRDQPTWKHYQAAAPSSQDVQRWSRADPLMNIAIVTGRVSGLLVADADGPQAVAWMEAEGAPQTPTSATSPEKRHFLFRFPADGGRPFTNRTALLKFPDGSQIDIRAEGGYIVAPGSIHPSGGLYAWVEGTEALEPAPVPGRLLDLLRPAEVQASASQVTTTTEQKEEGGYAAQRRAAYVEKVLRDELDKLTAAREGTRNDTLFKATARLYQFVKVGDLQDTDVEREIRKAARHYVAGDGEHAFAKTFESGKKCGLAEYPQLPDFEEGAPAESTTTESGTNFAPGTRQALRQLRDILTTRAEGWDAGTLRMFAVTQLDLMINEQELTTRAGGAAYMATVLGISKSTATIQLERLEASGLAEWDKGEARQSANGETVRNSRATFHRHNSPLPDLAIGAKQQAARDRTERARQKGWEAQEKLAQAVCTCCGATGELHTICHACGHEPTSQELATALAIEYMPDCKACGDRLPLVEGLKACPACGEALASLAPRKKARGKAVRSSYQSPIGGTNFVPGRDTVQISDHTSHLYQSRNRTDPPPEEVSSTSGTNFVPAPLEPPPDDYATAVDWLENSSSVEPFSEVEAPEPTGDTLSPVENRLHAATGFAPAIAGQIRTKLAERDTKAARVLLKRIQNPKESARLSEEIAAHEWEAVQALCAGAGSGAAR